jgi:hypothetical protein
MLKYKIVNNNKCKIYEEVETSRHLLWECKEARTIWELFNKFVTQID